jgi:hypothetical protein
MPDDHHAHGALLCFANDTPMRASHLSLIGLLSLFTNEWPRPSFATLRKGKPASFRLFPVGSYVVVCGAGSFLQTLFGLLKAIR